ncbi:hypothetical protein BY996DRAFT_6412254 [Phakopsora pachyrhizi]|uniref:Vacuolar ATPase assembly protein VMA22 n=1 Tax=Phakopsora pachyrhizi TaxID=170000 RepID=A0AAV0AGU6_PHAPC|nr:hypothetical protein BY996DRAFT_6412254 [Phakopsora pachyrhizi]CAH7667560.1 expressed protein [Phakopsora pachyrhizi]
MNTDNEVNEISKSLDYSLISYLDLIDQYYQCYNLLEIQLREAHFSLTKSKLVLGPLRISPSSYDLKPKQSVKEIRINDKQNEPSAKDSGSVNCKFNFSLSLITNVRFRSISNSIKGNMDSNSEIKHQNGLRQRKVRKSSFSNQSKEHLKDQLVSSGDDETKYLGAHNSAKIKNKSDDYDEEEVLDDPIHQFAALPPPALKISQSKFSDSLETMIKILNKRLEIAELESAIKLYEERLKRASLND